MGSRMSAVIDGEPTKEPPKHYRGDIDFSWNLCGSKEDVDACSQVVAYDLTPCEDGNQVENWKEPHTLCNTVKSPDQASLGTIALSGPFNS
ncbi:hypothetical protein STEG23_002003, partial [Scotinomys teguina]